jgi:hypothetical protein
MELRPICSMSPRLSPRRGRHIHVDGALTVELKESFARARSIAPATTAKGNPP